ncbi:MAG: tetratricopeptide repeat protein, partial [Coriobacteriia bacterium]|nr:tetratricopeptide repeat protein [Coriobacteriia bacterium]
VAQGDYAAAVADYRSALDDPEYTGHYRALQGLAGGLVQMGRIEEAAAAYRQAALDSDNPDSGKALNNLGLCFMSLGRPADAVEAYKAALGFEAYDGRGRALANLGIAFHALGEHVEAAKAFEKAVQLHGHTLSDQSLQAFQASREALLRSEPQRETVEGWQTGELPPFDLVQSDAVAVAHTGTVTHPGSTATTGDVAAGEIAFDASDHEGEESAFFTRTDQEMREVDREHRRRDREHRRSERNPLHMAATIVGAIVVVVATAAAFYFSGYGFPTQSMTVDGLLSARSAGDPVEGYWVAVPDADVDKEMAKIPPIKQFSVDEVERAARTSVARITVTPDNGTPLRYEITLTREGVGWKVSGVANDWRSTGNAP